VKVQQLIDRLADFRGDANVTCWLHNEDANTEINVSVDSVDRDRNGNVGLNWHEDAASSAIGSFRINIDE